MSSAADLRREADALYASAQASNRLNDRDRADIAKARELYRRADVLDGIAPVAVMQHPEKVSTGLSKADKIKAAIEAMRKNK